MTFKDLGLLVVDEEQRFGVAHKERLKQLRAHVDVLTMTATPIPRTLEMALTGIRDMSHVDTPPEDRQPVLTYVGAYDEGLALGARAARAAARGPGVLGAQPDRDDRPAGRVAAGAAARRRAIVVAHGQMDEDALEQQMMRFWDREADVLVCTAIIESGLDVPNANTLVVDSRRPARTRADVPAARARGPRDGAGVRLLLLPAARASSPRRRTSAWRRSPHIRRSAAGSRSRCATSRSAARATCSAPSSTATSPRSASTRTPGSLQESVAEMQGEPSSPRRSELRIDLPVKAFVPPGWVAQEALRLDLYRRISTARRPRAARGGPRRDRGPLRRAARRRSRRCSPSRRCGSRRRASGSRRSRRTATRCGSSRSRSATRCDSICPSASRRRASTKSRGRSTSTPDRIAGADLPAWVEAKLARGGRRNRGRCYHGCVTRLLPRLRVRSFVVIAFASRWRRRRAAAGRRSRRRPCGRLDDLPAAARRRDPAVPRSSRS